MTLDLGKCNVITRFSDQESGKLALWRFQKKLSETKDDFDEMSLRRYEEDGNGGAYNIRQR